MGWCFLEGQTKKALVNDLIRDESREKGIRKVLAHSLRGNCLWTVVYVGYPVGKTRIFIHLDLLQKHGGSWGYKDLSEEEGPCYYNCPIKFLDQAPVANEEWRESVREYHAETTRLRKMRIEPGMKFQLLDCTVPWATIVEVAPRRIIGVYQGVRYRLQKRLLGTVIA